MKTRKRKGLLLPVTGLMIAGACMYARAQESNADCESSYSSTAPADQNCGGGKSCLTVNNGGGGSCSLQSANETSWCYWENRCG